MRHQKYDSYGFRIRPKKMKKNNQSDTINNGVSITRIIGLIVIFIIILVCTILGLVSAYTAWHCYGNDFTSVRTTKTILAGFGFVFYLPYFVFLRYILKKPCLSQY